MITRPLGPGIQLIIAQLPYFWWTVVILTDFTYRGNTGKIDSTRTAMGTGYTRKFPHLFHVVCHYEYFAITSFPASAQRPS